ncbi:MAG: RNA polymerase sigma factor [Myxococcota bacterium]|jgi:RNA polymerase sigma-70 factor (ECF subfamily)|nr:RNA polymerase sigma factor [Myxococcota bacterium]
MASHTHLRLASSSRDVAADDDGALVARVLAREPTALRDLYARTSPLLERVLLRTIGPDGELEDLLHEAFIRVLESLDKLVDPRALPGWTVRIGARTALDCLRRRRRMRWLRFRPPEEVPEVAVAGLADESRAVLTATARVLDRIPPEDRVAFALRVIDGRTLAEVADACDCSLATTKRRIARAETAFVQLARTEPALRPWMESGRWGGADG